MLFVRGVVVKRTKDSVTNRIIRVKYTVTDTQGDLCVIVQLTTDLSRCLKVSGEVQDIPVNCKVYKNELELQYNWQTLNDVSVVTEF